MVQSIIETKDFQHTELLRFTSGLHKREKYGRQREICLKGEGVMSRPEKKAALALAV